MELQFERSESVSVPLTPLPEWKIQTFLCPLLFLGHFWSEFTDCSSFWQLDYFDEWKNLLQAVLGISVESSLSVTQVVTKNKIT